MSIEIHDLASLGLELHPIQVTVQFLVSSKMIPPYYFPVVEVLSLIIVFGVPSAFNVWQVNCTNQVGY